MSQRSHVHHHHHDEDDRDHLIEDDTSSTNTEHIMMSGLSQTSFSSASTFITHTVHHALHALM